jgi:hypothetical protein
MTDCIAIDQTDQTDRQTDRQTGRQAGADRQTAGSQDMLETAFDKNRYECISCALSAPPVLLLYCIHVAVPTSLTRTSLYSRIYYLTTLFTRSYGVSIWDHKANLRPRVSKNSIFYVGY